MTNSVEVIFGAKDTMVFKYENLTEGKTLRKTNMYRKYVRKNFPFGQHLKKRLTARQDKRLETVLLCSVRTLSSKWV